MISVFVHGRLTKDPETKAVGTGSKTTLYVVSNRKFKNAKGEAVEKATYLDCELWGKTGEVAAEYLNKGDTVILSGQLEQDNWEKDGQKRSKLYLRVDSFEFGQKKRGGDGPVDDESAKSEEKSEPVDTVEAEIPF